MINDIYLIYKSFINIPSKLNILLLDTLQIFIDMYYVMWNTNFALLSYSRLSENGMIFDIYVLAYL